MTEQQFIALLIAWICSGVVGAIIGQRHDRANAGFALGILFGPLGAIAAFALDGRHKCPECRNRIESGVRLCPVCKSHLAWLNDEVGFESDIAFRKAEREYKSLLRRNYERTQAEEAIRQTDHFWRHSRELALKALRAPARLLWASVCMVGSFYVSLDRWLQASVGRATARFLQVFWLAVVPIALLITVTMVGCPGGRLPADDGQMTREGHGMVGIATSFLDDALKTEPFEERASGQHAR